jgi:hypothetical protein
MSDDRRLRMMVSSTVYGIESLLDQIYATLEGFGYEVWMSHKGTIPTNPQKSNFQNCLDAVEQCDLFLGIITGRYGAAVVGEPSITHQEVSRAIGLGKLRWFLVHHDVTVARQLLRQFRVGREGRWRVKVKSNAVLDDVRVIDLYEEAIQQNLPLGERTGNWVQSYFTNDDALRFLVAQFSEPRRLRLLLGRELGE